MADKERLTLLAADRWAVQPADADSTAVVFRAGEHASGAVLSNEDLSRFAGTILRSAIEYARTQSPLAEDGEQITAVPIPVNALGVSAGRVETEAILTLRCGNLTLTFAVEAAMLHGMCTSLVPALRQLDPPSSH